MTPARAAVGELWRDPAYSETARIEDLMRRLTLEEKIRLLHGNVTKDPVELFHAGGVPRLGIGQLKMLDGRQGIRPLGGEMRTTALPCTLSLSCSWDLEAARAFGKVLAEELLAMEQHVLLGPCMNLMRSPLGGRNFENLGEDPFLAGRIATAYIEGVQREGVGACAAILVANDAEKQRHFTSSNLDDQTLRELHLKPFEMAMRDGHVWTVMSANSLYNGIHNAENRRLLQEILKDEMGYDGVLLTDWRAAYNPVECALAGTDMVTGFCAYVFGDGRLLEAVKSGEVPEKLIDEKVRRVLRLYIRTGVLNPETRKKGVPEGPEHRAEARRLAAEGMVLLKNDRGLLPIDPAKVKTILVTGPGANVVPAGTGSGSVRPPFEITPLQGIQNALGEKVKIVSMPWETSGVAGPKPALTPAAAGQKKAKKKGPTAMTLKAPDVASLREAARGADLVLFFVTGQQFGEGGDLKSLDLPGPQAESIAALTEANPNVVAVLLTGGPVSLEPWADKTPAILAAWYAGQATGDAVADVLTGKVNPGGKLSFTWGKQLNDYACHALGLWPPRLILEKDPGQPGFTPEERKAIHAFDADYQEGVFMGYRWFDEKNIEPRFAFGHGLSYTTFEMSGLYVKPEDSKGLDNNPQMVVACTVRNTGPRAGAEVVQVYVAPPKSGTPRPPQELKGFAKVFLKPGESKRVEVELRVGAMAYYEPGANSWVTSPGIYEILVGSSSREIKLRGAWEKVYEPVPPTAILGRPR